MVLLDPSARPVIGHRGNRAHAPENTLESLLEAVGLGVDALEFDLHVTADQRLVLLHDPTLDRTTDATGAVAQRTVADLQAIDAGARFSPDGGQTFPWRGRGVRVPTFDAVVESLPRDLPLIIELKTPSATPLVREAIARHGLARRVIVAGFAEAAIAPLRGAGFPLGATQSDTIRLLATALRGGHAQGAFDALCMPPRWYGLPLPMRAFARAIQRAGKVLHVWTVNAPSEAVRLWDVGVHGIISDDPAAILAARASA